MKFDLNYHKSPAVLHVGCEEPRAYFIPHGSDQTAATDNCGLSDRFVSLCGDWDFKFTLRSAILTTSPRPTLTQKTWTR